MQTIVGDTQDSDALDEAKALLSASDHCEQFCASKIRAPFLFRIFGKGNIVTLGLKPVLIMLLLTWCSFLPQNGQITSSVSHLVKKEVDTFLSTSLCIQFMWFGDKDGNRKLLGLSQCPSATDSHHKG